MTSLKPEVHTRRHRRAVDDTQSATDRYRYRAFGKLDGHDGASDSPFTFVGKRGYCRDSELDLYLLDARYYDPAIGRFVNQDPLGLEAGDVNLYR